MPRQGRGTTRRGTPYSRGGARGRGQASSRATRRGGCASNSQSTTLSESQSTTLTRGDIPALVQEVVQSLTRRSNPSHDNSACENTSSQSVEPNATRQTPLPPSRRRSETALMDSGPGTEEDPHLPLTREVIPSLVQQVLQALPRASSSTLTHANAAADPSPPPQSTNSSTEQHPCHLQVS